MKKSIFVLLAALFLAAPAFAQESGWFVTVGGGANIFFEGNYHDNASNGITPAVSVGVGKWVTPSVGIKLGYDGYQLKCKNYFPKGINYNAATASVLWNVNNTFGGVNPDRVISFVPYAFVGVALGVNPAFTGGAGISLPIRISKLISIVPDIKGAYLRDNVYTKEYDGSCAILEPTLALRFSF